MILLLNSVDYTDLPLSQGYSFIENLVKRLVIYIIIYTYKLGIEQMIKISYSQC